MLQPRKQRINIRFGLRFIYLVTKKKKQAACKLSDQMTEFQVLFKGLLSPGMYFPPTQLRQLHVHTEYTNTQSYTHAAIHKKWSPFHTHTVIHTLIRGEHLCSLLFFCTYPHKADFFLFSIPHKFVRTICCAVFPGGGGGGGNCHWKVDTMLVQKNV